MDKLNHYRHLVKKILTHHAELATHNPSKTRQTHLIFDVDRDRYMLFDIGWWDKKRIHTPILYVHLHEGKIWIEEDWTEDGIAADLITSGIPKDDVVLAFHHPTIRPLTDFAIA